MILVKHFKDRQSIFKKFLFFLTLFYVSRGPSEEIDSTCASQEIRTSVQSTKHTETSVERAD